VPAPLVSIVIPTREERATLPGLLEALAREPEPHEVIVVDAGSDDGTADIAEAAGALVLQCACGRGQQLAMGAGAARADVLLFLHADTAFPTGGLAAMLRALADAPDSPGGNFRLLFDGEDPLRRWLDRFYAFIRRFGFIYGDSGIFVRREAFLRAGGFRSLAVMEDYDFVRRLRRLGRLLNVVDPPLVTSTRRFRARRRPAIVARWLAIHVLYYLGASGERMARIYDAAPGATPLQRGSLSDQS
jgi:rSAM/selenodomain-associated transferase 2